MWETSSGVQWKGFGDKNIQPQYNGEVLIGKPNGLGVIIFPNGIRYVGEWRYGNYEGQGTYTYGKGNLAGHKYKGKFRGGYRNGQGTYTWSDGRKYKGEFKNGKKHGRGTFTSINGYKYLGEWRKDKPWNVKFFDKNGNIIGKFVNGVKIIEEPVVVVKKKPVVVVEKWQTGVLFRRWENQQWGWFSDGDEKKDRKYVGKIENGGPNGQGTLTKPNGDKYVGEFWDGYRNGQGTYTWSGGSKYVGEWKDDKKMVKEHTFMEKGN